MADHDWNNDRSLVMDGLKRGDENDKLLFSKVEEIRIQIGVLNAKMAMWGGGGAAAVVGVIEFLRMMMGA